MRKNLHKYQNGEYIKTDKSGDRKYRQSMERKFPNRIPKEAQIALPNTSTKVFYNSDSMRVVHPQIIVGDLTTF